MQYYFSTSWIQGFSPYEAEITSDLEGTVLGNDAINAVDECSSLSDKVTFRNIQTFARTGDEDDLTADDSTVLLSTDEEIQELVRNVAGFVFFNCLRREIEEDCLVEANCQLEKLQTLSAQC